MAIYEIDGTLPHRPQAYVQHPDAVVIGDVTIGAESTIWPGAVLRGDYGTITVGTRSSVQDGSVIHATAEFPMTIGDGASSVTWPIWRAACSRTTPWSVRGRWCSTAPWCARAPRSGPTPW